MVEKIVNDLKIDLGEENTNEDFLFLCAERAIRYFQGKRNYPPNFTNDRIKKDMEQCYDCIYDIALYKVNKRGIEFEMSRSESGTRATYQTEDSIFLQHGIFPFVSFVGK